MFMIPLAPPVARTADIQAHGALQCLFIILESYCDVLYKANDATVC